MKIGASYWMFEGGLEAALPVADAMAQAKELGFDAIELCVAGSGVLTHETTRGQCEAILGKAGELGIEVASVASGESWGCSPSDDDPAVRARIVEFTRQALQVAAWLGTDAYLYVPGAVDVFFLENSPVVPYDVCDERARAAIRQILPAAERLGVTLAVENVWNKFLLSPLEMRDFIDSFGSPAVGSYFDVGNVVLTGYPEHWIDILGKRIARVHVKDFKRSAGTAEGFVDLLEGDVDFEAVKAALARIGYDGYVTAEMIPYQPGRPEKTAAAMKKLFK
jgi:L-ribulose-5-phosphate 3-epimerase